MSDIPALDEPLDAAVEPVMDDVPVTDISDIPDLGDTPDIEPEPVDDSLATVHAGNEIETEHTIETEPITVSTEPPEGYHPGGPEGGF